MLNKDQRRVFDNVKAHFQHQNLHEANQCSCDFAPLRMFVSGVGGTGKSFLIEAIKALVNSLWSSESLLCGVAAPTGLAAFEVASPFHIQTAVFTSDNPVNILGRRGWVEVASPFCNNTTLKLQQILI